MEVNIYGDYKVDIFGGLFFCLLYRFEYLFFFVEGGCVNNKLVFLNWER